MVDSRETAQRLILAGKVLVGEVPARKPSQLVGENEPVQITESLKYVSRGGLKLEKALQEFHIEVRNKMVLDVGASTGGFTDCLLQNGAQKVFAIDVGYGQLAWKLMQDPRVAVIDRVNARFLRKEMISESIDMAVVDVSFISAHLILAALLAITGEVILLLKPQFEAGKRDVPKGGVIRNPETHRMVLHDFFGKLRDWHVYGLTDSPIEGGSGNREFLVHLKRDASRAWDEGRYQKRVEELIH